MALTGAAGCGPILEAPPSARDERPAQSQSSALAQLADLKVAPWASMAGYKRDRFADWASQGDGCNTRDVVLKRDGTSVKVGDDCKITSGRWVSAYDGAAVTDPQELDIDHMVPLANAWRTGAAEWTAKDRAEFANDLARPQLLAVTASSNRSKGDQDPSQWQPPNEQFWCTYAKDWVAVKAHWRLWVTEAEKDALTSMLELCSD